MKKPWILMLLVALVIAGCSTPQPTPKLVPPPPPPDKRITFSPSLHNAIQLVEVNGGRGAGGYYGVHVKLRNDTKELKRVSYRVNWLDAAGEPINLPAGRVVPWILLGGETASLSITSPTPLAKDFNMEFVEAAP